MARNTSLPIQLFNFTSQTTGLDLTLRLLQALTQIGTEILLDADTIKQCATATAQLALGRRYLRLFSFIGCFARTHELLLGPTSTGSILTLLGLVESSCLGVYLLMENFTILHDMNVQHAPWSTPLLHEANKFWFYAICASIMASLWELFSSPAAGNQPQKADGKSKSEKANSASAAPPTVKRTRMALLTRVVVDACDLALPASFLKWTSLGDLGVGVAMVVSTVLAGQEEWVRAQGLAQV